MPKRRQKREDTSNSDQYEEQFQRPNKIHFGSVQLNRFLPPDLIDGDDATKYSILAWSNTLQAQRLLPWNQRKDLFQRALKYLPFSYKIWHMYLQQYIEFCGNRSIYSSQYKMLNQTFEKALQKLPKMPRLWIMYAQTLEKQHLLSKVRSVFNWSFRNLPLTQHEKIWHKFSIWSMKLQNANTALSVIPRYIKLNPDFKEQFANYLKQKKMFDKCVNVLLNILKDEGYHSKSNKSKKDFQFEIVEIITEFSELNYNIQGQKFIRDCIVKYPGQEGQLWVKLSEYFTRRGQFERSRQIFQEALQKINNVKDFGIIFNSYTKFQDQMITALGSQQIQSYAQVKPEDNLDYQLGQRLKKLQNLIQRQPFMLSKINVRRAPNDVKSWIAYAQLYEVAGDIQKSLQIIDQGLQIIEPELVQNGMLSSLWIKKSKIYQELNQLRKCNQVLNQATQVNYRLVEDYFNIWIRWIQMLLEQSYYNDALKVVKHVLFKRKNKAEFQLKVKNIDDLLRSNISLWQLYIDIQISIGNFEDIKLAYQRCKQHKSLTPIMLLNLTNFLWQNAYFQQTFRVFQFAVNSFKWPSLYEIWISYISKFTSRYNNDAIGVQRARSMFQRLLKSCPDEYTGLFHYIYAKFQQQYGMISYAINIYDSMIQKVPKQQRGQAYCIYISKVARMLGITKTRAIFESALQKLNEKQILKIGKEYAKLEMNLGEIERSRAVFVYICQFTDPRDDMDEIWDQWQNFEVEHGDKQTYKEYLRIKRSVQAKYEMLPPDLEKIQEKVKKGLI